MSCDFPSSNFGAFTKLEALYLGYNDFSGQFDEVASALGGKLFSLKVGG